ncbi:MAG TPA: DUF3277 domain-containing protein [Burkholderiaceae bacterium]|nr:DUF3277 domain-containing protein [Burkholderiaceae bacterium]
MAEVKTYSPDRVKVIVGVAALSGFADGTFVDIEPLGDGITSESGADGEVVRAMSLDTRHAITVTLQQSSRSNDILSALHLADRVSGGEGAVPVAVTDLRGTTLFGGTGWVVKKAKATFSKGLEAREWTLEAAGEFHNGGTN